MNKVFSGRRTKKLSRKGLEMTTGNKEKITYEEKRKELRKRIEAYASMDMVVAFSGGADSSLLLKLACEAAKKCGSRVYAITMQTELHTLEDLQVAEKVAKETGAFHVVLHVDELEEAGIEDNPVDRCYRCKKLLFTRMRAEAEKIGASVLLEGTNADDLKVYRPGLKAIRELGIKSPLAEAGFTKSEVRTLAGEYGISVAKRPSTPCMATRFPYGTRLTRENLKRAEDGEGYIRSLGFYNVRLRVYGETARIEVDESEFDFLIEHRKEIIKFLKNLGYVYIALDLEGFRSGSMDVGIAGGTSEKSV